MNAKIVVIGSGPGGLGFAALAARKGYSVTVLEAGPSLGPSEAGFELEGFQFQSGQPWLMLPDVFESYFDLLGISFAGLFDLVQLDPAYRVFLRGESRSFDFYSEPERDAATYEMLESGAGQQFKLHLQHAGAQYETARRALLYKNHESARELSSRRASAEIGQLDLTTSWTQSLARHFHNEDVQKILQYPALLLGVSPSQAPALFAALGATAYPGGTRYPRGGMAQLSGTLAKIGADWGVVYRTDAVVTKILTRRGPAIRGVQLQDGGVLDADIVVSDLDIPASDALLPDAYGNGRAAPRPGHWSRRLTSPGTLQIFLGVRGGLPSLAHHNLLISRDWRAFFARLLAPGGPGFDPSLHVGVPSKTEPGLAPGGHETMVITLLVPGGPQPAPGHWEDLADCVIALLETELDITDLRQRIAVRRVVHQAASNARRPCGGPHPRGATGLMGGVLSRFIARDDWLGATNVSSHVDGLYFVGPDTGPAIGLPGRLIAAELAFKRVIGDQSSGHLATL